MWADDAACAPCEATECSGGLQPCSGCTRFEVSLVCDAMARGGGAEAGARVRAEARSGPSSSERAQDDLLDAAARSQRAGRSNDVLDLLAAESRVSEETWHGLGRDRHGDRAFSHSCGRMCLHGMARHEPDKFRFLNEKLKAARKAVKEHAAGQAVAATGGATVYDQDILGVAPTELHAAAKELRAEEHSEAEAKALDAAETQVYRALLDCNCCVDGALLFVGRARTWAYHARRADEDADADATGAEPGAATGATGGGSSRAPGIDKKRQLSGLLPPNEVRMRARFATARAPAPTLTLSLSMPACGGTRYFI